MQEEKKKKHLFFLIKNKDEWNNDLIITIEKICEKYLKMKGLMKAF